MIGEKFDLNYYSRKRKSNALNFQHSCIIEKHKKEEAAESAFHAIKFWCNNDNQRYMVDSFWYFKKIG